ncbi:ABC transporter permease [Ethanoligenens sp.]|uniref:ABC transporter permease n=1 Tax=Ethanoligenens sp. TaxID=2099655 RepID=UPI0039EA63F6
MKPLSPLLYLKNNAKTALTIFFAMAICVFLVNFYGLFSATTTDTTLNGSLNLMKTCTEVYSTNDVALPPAFLQKLDAQKNANPLPVLNNLNGGLRYSRGMASSSMTIFNMYAADAATLLRIYHMRLSQGRMPRDNAHEILVTRDFVLQNGLNVGDAVGTEIADKYQLPGRYVITGLLDGPLVFAVVCQTESTPRDVMRQYSLIYRIDHMSVQTQKTLKNLLPRTAMVLDYYTFSNQLYGQLQMMQILAIIITAMMVVILCIALGNLNVITFATRQEEFAILSAIGYPKRRLVRKLWEETVLVCFMGYGAGVILTSLTAWLLNQTIYMPQGAPLVLYDVQGSLAALTIPILVSVFSILPGIFHNFFGHANFSV